MQWYYAENDAAGKPVKQVGPFSDQNFQALVDSGTVSDKTLVWHEGMPSWVAYGTTRAEQTAAAGAPPDAGKGICCECKKMFPLEEMISYEDSLVCAECKTAFFQRIKEGAQAAGNTHNRDIMAQARHALSGRWWLCIGVNLLSSLISSAASSIPFCIGYIVAILIAAPMAIGLNIFYLSVVRSEEARVRMIFEGFRCFGTALGSLVLMGLLLSLWSLPMLAAIGGAIAAGVTGHLTLAGILAVSCVPLLIPPSIAAYAYSMTFYVIADDADVGPLTAIRKSIKMMRGRKWKFFCLSFFRFLGWVILCILPVLLGIVFGASLMRSSPFLGIGPIVLGGLATFAGFLWLAPYMSTSIARFYDDVKVRGMLD